MRRASVQIRQGRSVRSLTLVAWVAALGLSGSARAEPSAQGLEIHPSRITGLASFVKPAAGRTIAVERRGPQRQIQPLDFLQQYGHVFGVTAPEEQLRVREVQTDSIGYSHTTYQQYHAGVRVFSGILKVHQDANGEVTAANGDFYPIPPEFDTTAIVSSDEAVALAKGQIESGAPAVESSELVIVDPGWYGDPPRGARLAYYILLKDALVPLHEAFFVDARSGEILDRWSLIENTPGGLGAIRDRRRSAAAEQQ